MEKIKVGVFGGARGYAMIQQLIDNPDAELVAVCDKYRPLLDKVKATADQHNMEVALYENFEDFIRHDMDAVILANYAHQHAPFAIRCLDAGMHVMSEVLPCCCMAEAVALIEAVERSGKVYAYAENYCYMKAPFEMRLRYAKGEIGEVMYCEGEYIHDTSSIWPDITYGERDHWRNHESPSFYNTHSMGPLLTITGLRPVQVVGFETNLIDTEKQKSIGCHISTGIELVTLENGAICKSIHGHLKMEPGSISYQVYGKSGMMQSGRYGPSEFNIYKEDPAPDRFCIGSWENYDPEIDICREEAARTKGHGGSDFYPTHFFIEKILGRPDGRWSIDVYTAIDMGICGLLAHRSLLNGNQPMAIPNLRNPAEREAYRNDYASTYPEVSGDQLLPITAHKEPDYGDDVYEHVRDIWMSHQGKK